MQMRNGKSFMEEPIQPRHADEQSNKGMKNFRT